MNGIIRAIYISPSAGEPMVGMKEVVAIAGLGLEGDRYARAAGSWNKDKPGKRQVTLINTAAFKDSGFEYSESRRNIVVQGTELMFLIGKEFQIGEARFKGEKYCEPCPRPSKLLNRHFDFQEAFHELGGLVAEVLVGGVIKEGDLVIPPPKNYKS